MCLHRIRTNEKFGGNTIYIQPLGQQLDYFQFAFAEDEPLFIAWRNGIDDGRMIVQLVKILRFDGDFRI